MRFILLGAPGAGKGTQADFLSQEFHIPKIATGDMLRLAAKEETPLGQKIKNIMRSGELVPDDMMIELVKDRISKPDCQDGFLHSWHFKRRYSSGSLGIGLLCVLRAGAFFSCAMCGSWARALC